MKKISIILISLLLILTIILFYTIFTKYLFISKIDPNDYEIKVGYEDSFGGIDSFLIIDSDMSGKLFVNDLLVKEGVIKSKTKREILNEIKNRYPYKRIFYLFRFAITDHAIHEISISSKDFSKKITYLDKNRKNNIYEYLRKFSDDLEPTLSPEELLKYCQDNNIGLDQNVCLTQYSIIIRDAFYCNENEEESKNEYSCTQIVNKWINSFWY